MGRIGLIWDPEEVLASFTQGTVAPIQRRILLLVGKPLCCQSWPFQGSTENHIIEEWCILLPRFVF